MRKIFAIILIVFSCFGCGDVTVDAPQNLCAEFDLGKLLLSYSSSHPDDSSFILDSIALEIDSIFFYEPYTSFHRVSYWHHINFSETTLKKTSDDSWCLVIIKGADKRYYYHFLKRKFDVAPIKGAYGKSDLKNILFTKSIVNINHEPYVVYNASIFSEIN